MLMRVGTRLGTALAVTLVPLAAAPVTVTATPTAAFAHTRSGSGGPADPGAAASTAPPAASVTPSPALLDTRAVAVADQTGLPSYPPQRIAPQTVLQGRLLPSETHKKIRLEGPRGERVWTASALTEHDLPSAAMGAYKHAAASMAASDPSCHIPWTLLAGIGRVESDHGRYAGSVLGSDGISRPAIIGVALNGDGPVAAVPDTDNGVYDGDTVWDRAVGPMQFIPSTWATSGRDGDGDGVKNPNDINDAALAAAGYLCGGGGDLSTDAGMAAAIFRYNPSDYYVQLVMAFAKGYRTGSFVIPSPPAPKPKPAAVHHEARKSGTASPSASAKKKTPHAAKATASHGATGSASPTAHGSSTPSKASGPSTTSSPTKTSGPTKSPTSSQPSGSSSASGSPTKSTGPSPSGTPTGTGGSSGTPSPTPSGPSTTPPSTTPPSTTPPSTPPSPSLTEVSGTLAGSGQQWTLDGKLLVFGADAPFTTTARHDYDGDGVVETLTQELEGLKASGGRVTFQVEQGGPLAVYGIVDPSGHLQPYRNADGSLAR